MELEQFIKDFTSQFDDTDPAAFNADTAFKELEEWSSVVAFLIIVMTDEKYNVKINREDILSSQTLNDLYKIVESECNKKMGN
jgi:acyl carrier protein